jgi:hypothetical protein
MKKSAGYEYRLLSAVALNYLQGLLRLEYARAAALSAMLAMRQAHGPELPARDKHALWTVVDVLCNVEYSAFDSFCYLSDVVYLVYGTTLFDCFLSEITRFLFLRHPAALGDEYPIKLQSVLHARSRYDVLNLAVGKRVRDLGYKTFRERLRVLDERFGLKVGLPRKVQKALEHYSSRRNAMVHDQAFLEVRLNGRGKLVVKGTKSPRRPTPVTGCELRDAIDAYSSSVRLITEAVAEQVLGFKKGSPEIVQLRKWLGGDLGATK